MKISCYQNNFYVFFHLWYEEKGRNWFCLKVKSGSTFRKQPMVNVPRHFLGRVLGVHWEPPPLKQLCQQWMKPTLKATVAILSVEHRSPPAGSGCFTRHNWWIAAPLTVRGFDRCTEKRPTGTCWESSHTPVESDCHPIYFFGSLAADSNL